MQNHQQVIRRRLPIFGIFLFLALAGTVTLWFFRGPLQNRITRAGVLSNDAPPPELVKETILNATDPRAALLAAWNSGTLIHREVAIRTLPDVISKDQPLAPPFDSLLLAATLDPDMDVRESAFTILRERQDPRSATMAAAQLSDPDEKVRLLGLFQFKYIDAATGVPTVVPLLDDADPLIVTTALHLLEKWSGEKFGVRFRDVSKLEEEDQIVLVGQQADRDAKLASGIQSAKAWWVQHQSEFPSVQLTVPEEAYTAQMLLPAGDFELQTLDGKKVRLSDFRGKVVLINFWTTWCTACVSEMPRLIALQKKYDGKLVILGVSLDAVPDEDGDMGDETPTKGQKVTHHEGDKLTTAELENIGQKVARTAKTRGINYPILLDVHDEVGGRFNGGELPTTVIVDAQGNIRRRFIGARSLPEFEAMLAEASSNSAAYSRF